jgi:hypothetical protein
MGKWFVSEGELEHNFVAPVPQASVFIWLMVPDGTRETQFHFAVLVRFAQLKPTDIRPRTPSACTQ